MSNFEQITASPEALGAFLASLPVATGPWNEAFHKEFCASCTAENCDAENCPHNVERGNPAWWLMLSGEEKAAPAIETQRRQQEGDRPVGYDAFMEKTIAKISQAIGLTANHDICG